MLIGPNGAGKTTLFHCIAGTLQRRPPGACCCSATTSRDLPEHRRTALGMGRTFQISNVFTDLTVIENLPLVDHRHRSRASGSCTVRWLRSRPCATRRSSGSSRVGLDERADETVKFLSYGERRQLELALALNTAPESAAPRRALRGTCRRASGSASSHMIRELPRDITLVMIEHDIDVALGARRPRHRAASRPGHSRRHARAKCKPTRKCGRCILATSEAAARPCATSTPITATAMCCRALSLTLRNGAHRRHPRPQRHGQDHADPLGRRPDAAAPRARSSFAAARCAASRPTPSPRQGIAIVPQGRRIFKSLTVRENLLLPTSVLARAHVPARPMRRPASAGTSTRC